MAKRFSLEERRTLEKNPNIVKASERSIAYHPAFKKKVVLAHKEGCSPTEVFLESGFDLTVIGKDQPKRCLSRWRKVFDQYGEIGLETERRGKGSTGRPPSHSLSTKEKLKKAEARIHYLEAENDFLKKLEELERQAFKKKRS